jgi:hypothetical protein
MAIALNRFMKELTLRRLVAFRIEHGTLYEIEEDRIQGESLDDLEEEVRLIVRTDKSVLGIETICIVEYRVERDVHVA